MKTGRHSYKFALLCLVSLCCGSAGRADVAQRFDSSIVGAPESNEPAELFKPDGPGPFAAIVVLPGCDGVGKHYREWAARLQSWGYVAMLVDSFRPRGVTTVCNHGMLVPPLVQAQDAFAAADYLRDLPYVDGDRLGVIGFSHGGWAVLKAVLESTTQQDHSTPFAGAAAFYPGCVKPDSPLVSDTLILIGESDDWTPAAACRRWYDEVEKGTHTVKIKVYPNALHGFDSARMPHSYAGHFVGRDADAAADAIALARRFFARRIALPQQPE